MGPKSVTPPPHPNSILQSLFNNFTAEPELQFNQDLIQRPQLCLGLQQFCDIRPSPAQCKTANNVTLTWIKTAQTLTARPTVAWVYCSDSDMYVSGV